MKKLLLTLILALSLLLSTSCQKTEVPEKNTTPTQTTKTCNLEGKITKKDYTSEFDGYRTYIKEINGVPTQVTEPFYKYTYYIIVQYGQLQPTEIKLDKFDWDKYSVGSNYCLD